MKKLFIAIAAIVAVSFASCSQDESLSNNVQQQDQQAFVSGKIISTDKKMTLRSGPADSEKRVWSLYLQDGATWKLFTPTGDPNTLFYKDWSQANPYFGDATYGSFIPNQFCGNPCILPVASPVVWTYCPLKNIKVVSQTVNNLGQPLYMAVETFFPEPNFYKELKGGQLKDFLSISKLNTLVMNGYKFHIEIGGLQAKKIDVLGTAFATASTSTNGFPQAYVFTGDPEQLPTLSIEIDKTDGVRVTGGSSHYSYSPSDGNIVLFDRFRQRIATTTDSITVSWTIYEDEQTANFTKNPAGVDNGWKVLKTSHSNTKVSDPGFGWNFELFTTGIEYVGGGTGIQDFNLCVKTKPINLNN